MSRMPVRPRLRSGVAWLLLVLTACGSPAAVPGTNAEEPAPGAPTTLATTTTLPEPALDLEDCGDELVAGASTVECLGLEFELGIPAACLVEPCGLIVDFHPGGWSGKEVERATKLRSIGNDAGYVVVQPSAPQPLGRWSFAAHAGLVRTVLDSLMRGLPIDPTRVHVGGASLGAYMTWHFVCDHADLVASAAPLAGGIGETWGESCDFDELRSPSEEVDLLIFHGRTDSQIPFESGIALLELTTESWNMEPAEVIVDEPTYRWRRWTNDAGTVVEFVEFDWTGPRGDGHCYPGASGRGGCGTGTPVHYGEAALAFYVAHPKTR